MHSKFQFMNNLKKYYNNVENGRIDVEMHQKNMNEYNTLRGIESNVIYEFA